MKTCGKGYTLLEVMLVVIVMAILVRITIPRVVSIVERSRGAEAREVLYKTYAGYQRYIEDNTSALPAGDSSKWRMLGMSDPNSMTGRYFNYSFTPAGSRYPTSSTATRLGIAGNTITINLATGAITNTSPY
jgi:prepilin-type N-terminal cleavage/methylation domain-containing protein